MARLAGGRDAVGSSTKITVEGAISPLHDDAPDSEAELELCVLLETLAMSTAKMPMRKMPSNVPAPPIEATGAPSP